MALNPQGWASGGQIPLKHSQAGAELSPAFTWSAAPATTVSFVLLVHNVNADGTPGDVVLVWTTTDRLYMLTGRLADAELLAIADAIR